MKISTLSIGDELICGRVTDTNAGTIAAALMEHGLRVQRHVGVGDSEPDIIAALHDLSRSNEALIVTGGLGPTEDDLTARAAAAASGRPLVINEEALAHVREMHARLSRTISSTRAERQALLPADAALVHNPTGTASGFHLEHNGCSMFFLPGVPSEMVRMLNDSLIPLLLERLPRRRVILSGQFNLFGPSEPMVDELLSGIASPGEGLHLGICVNFPWIRVTLQAEAASEEAASALLEPACAKIRSRLAEHIFSEGAASMDEVLAQLFRERGLTLALAESCTGGMIAQRITDLSGSSTYFLEGAVTYNNAAKIRQLGVSSELLRDCGAVSAEAAAAMAGGIRSAAGSDLGLAVTGIAGPEGGSAEKPVGTVYISLAAPDGCRTERFQFGGSRAQVRIRATWTALDWLRRYLLGIPAGESTQQHPPETA